MKTLIVFALLCTVVVVYLLDRAPEGYEDSDGWHEGKPK